MTTARRSRWASLALTALLVLPATTVAGAPAPQQYDAATFGDLRARPIGPAVMSGRIAALDAAVGPPVTIWVGAAGGGVWVSRDAGVTFAPVFDDHVQSIGAIRIDPSDPDTVWVGTGESWVRNSVSAGDGIYRTTDGGESWTHLGLEQTERIARIVVHPQDPNTALVCATGALWRAGEERGVYRTTDAGATWDKVLYVDADTGCADLAMDPAQPETLYAGMWEFRRRADFFTSGGDGSALYRSTDGGDTWEELTAGLPAGDKGRIAVAVAPSQPEILYAVVEAEETALYRSEDRGETWERRSDSAVVAGRPFYFAYVVVDPEDPERVYKPGLFLGISEDGGESFGSPFSTSAFGVSVHSDHHALWIHPEDPNQLLLGTDGGLYISWDRARHWRHVGALPISQFYEIAVDGQFPYNVYGGLQDNGSWMGPSRAPGGVQNRHWRNIGSGDGFHAYPDPHDPNVIFSEWQGGRVQRLDLTTGETKDIRPAVDPAADPELEQLRFNWNTPVHLSTARPGRMYIGSQYLFRTDNRGDTWARISPDLTTDNPELQRQAESGGLTTDNTTAENHTTIFTISESSADPEVVWVGTDDGNLQVTRDGGATWSSVAGNVPGRPGGTWVSHVEASRHAPGTAFVTFDGHRNGDDRTYVYRTDDFGQSWTSLVGGELEGWAHVVVQDPVAPDLLFVGTELGLFLSIDGGAGWVRFTGGLPAKAPVHDLVIHPRESDLVIGTHGRGVWIVDDITPLRHLDAVTIEADVAMLPSRPSVMVAPAGLQQFPGDAEFVGENPSEAAQIVYWMKRRHLFGDLTLEILDADGEVVTTVPGGKRRGINRVEWPMRLPAPDVPPSTTLVPQMFSLVGPRVPEGTYTARLTKGSDIYEGEVILVPDPRTSHSEEDRALQDETVMRLYRLLNRLTPVVRSVAGLAEGARERAAALESVADAATLRADLEAWAGELDAFRGSLVATAEGGLFAGEEQLRERLVDLYGAVNGFEGRPTDAQIERASTMESAIAAAEARHAELTGTRLGDLNAALQAAGLDPLEAEGE